MLLDTDVCVRMVFVLEETGVRGGNPSVWPCDQMTISYADADDAIWGSAAHSPSYEIDYGQTYWNECYNMIWYDLFRNIRPPAQNTKSYYNQKCDNYKHDKQFICSPPSRKRVHIYRQ